MQSAPEPRVSSLPTIINSDDSTNNTATVRSYVWILPRTMLFYSSHKLSEGATVITRILPVKKLRLREGDRLAQG